MHVVPRTRAYSNGYTVSRSANKLCTLAAPAMQSSARGNGRKCWKSVLADGCGMHHDRAMQRTAPRKVAIVVFPGVQSLDVTGPLEVFSGAAQVIEDRADRGGAVLEGAAREAAAREAAAREGAAREGVAPEGAARAERGYEIRVLARDRAPLRTSSGLTLVPDG